MVPQPLRAATPATPIQSRLLHELGILCDSPNLEMVWSAPFQRSRAAEGPQNLFALDLAHELPWTICTQQDKCLSQPLLTVIAVDRESDVLSSGNQSHPRRRKWLVCPELGEPFCVVGMESWEIRLDLRL